MRLTVFSEYAIRTLMYVAPRTDRFVTIPEVATALAISSNHLTKVVRHLAAKGDLETLRGPHGGIRIARPARSIRVGDIVRASEPAMTLTLRAVHDNGAGHALPAILDKALAAFMQVLDECSIADLVAERHRPSDTPDNP